MNDRKSYLAFSLASEHHKFYMKLRNSFLSIKTLSDEFNIPLQITHADTNFDAILSSPTEMCENSLKVCESFSKSEPILSNPKQSSKPKIVRSLKKSMLNDNKLLKLKEKFLKRSKSLAEIKPVVNNVATTHTKEENQNKENECPHVIVVEPQPKPYTLSRNKVKMGTRVFSTQFLNKSVDNIYASPIDLYSIDVPGNAYEPECEKYGTVNGIDEDVISIKSTSVGSIYFSKKNPAIDENDEVPCVVRKYCI